MPMGSEGVSSPYALLRARSRADWAMPAFDEQLGQASRRPSVSAKTRMNRSETWDPQLSHSGIVLSTTT